jgi:putative polyhydroxyalkanoate system protein
MATIDIRRPHSLPKDQARGKAEELARSLQAKLGIEWRWAGDSLVFDAPHGAAKGTKGSVTVADAEVRVEVDLPFILRVLKGKVESKVHEKLDALL